MSSPTESIWDSPCEHTKNMTKAEFDAILKTAGNMPGFKLHCNCYRGNVKDIPTADEVLAKINDEKDKKFPVFLW